MPVVLEGGDEASGLADMLRQFLEQTLAESPRKRHQARALSGRALVRSTEDAEVCVCIEFAADHIELRDADGEQPGVPGIAADFLTLAHLTSGRENPFHLLARRRLEARFSFAQIPFLLRLLRFLRIESDAQRALRRRRAVLAATAVAGGVAACGIYWYATAGSGS